MDGSPDVLEPRPHLKREGEAGRQLRYALTYRLDAEHDVVVGTGDEAQKAVVGVERQGATVSRQWKVADLDAMCAGTRLVWRQTDRDDLRIGEAYGGDDHLVERTLLSRHDLCHHFALRKLAHMYGTYPPAVVNLQVMTFHAFAFRLLKRNPRAAGLPERFQLWGDPEQRRVFASRQMWWNEEVDILEIIGGAKERLLDADRFATTVDPDDDVLVEAVKFFRVYEQALREIGAIDFADMVPLLVKAIAGNEAYRRYPSRSRTHIRSSYQTADGPRRTVVAVPGH
jgi:hypothetical protein